MGIFNSVDSRVNRWRSGLVGKVLTWVKSNLSCPALEVEKLMSLSVLKKSNDTVYILESNCQVFF